jgi:hypothetical protein
VHESSLSVRGENTTEVTEMPWARHATGSDEGHLLQSSTEYVVVDETVAPGSELELVDAFGSIVERWRNDGAEAGQDAVRWTHDNPDLEVQLDGRPLRERPWAALADAARN